MATSNISWPNEKLAVICEINSEKLEIQIYDPENSWSIYTTQKLLHQKQYYSSIIIDEKLILVFGGGIGKAEKSVQYLDLRTFQWNHLPPMHQIRSCGHVQVANLNGNMCVYGGYTDIFETFEIYNFSTKKWHELPLAERRTFNSKITAQNGILYIIDFHRKILQTYDANSNKWNLIYLVSELHLDFGFAAVGGFLYIIGGLHNNKQTNSVKRYNLSSHIWCEVASLPEARSELETTVVGNKIVVCGGFPELNKVVQEYNTDTDKWTNLSSLLMTTLESSRILGVHPIKL